MRGAPVGVQPAAPADAARGHAGPPQRERVQRAPVEGLGDLDRAATPGPPSAGRRRSRRRSSRGWRAARRAGRRTGPWRGRRCRAHAGRTRDDRRASHLDLCQRARRRRPAGAAARARAQRSGTARRDRPRSRRPRSGHERGVDEAVVSVAAARTACASRAIAGSPARLARVGVQARELAAGDEAREALVPGLQPAAGELDGLARGPSRPAGHERRARRAEAVEALADLAVAHHDCEVVTELTELPLHRCGFGEDSTMLERRSIRCSIAPARESPPAIRSRSWSRFLFCRAPRGGLSFGGFARRALAAAFFAAAFFAAAPWRRRSGSAGGEVRPRCSFFEAAESAGSCPEASCT